MDATEALTFWEDVRHNTKWGQYITSIEHTALHTALRVVQKPSLALEIGTEGGHWTKFLVDQGWKVICTDIDKASLDVCKQRVPSATCIHVSPEATALPCETNSIDLIVCMEVFPVIHSHWFLTEATRVLRPGGVVVGVMHNRHSLRSYANKVMTAMDHKRKLNSDKDYLYKFAYQEWKQQLNATNLHLVHEEGMCWLPFPRKSNFFLIPHLTRLEQRLGLRQFTQLSPWIAFVAQKNHTQQ